jgi:hypothetical protein
LEFVLTSFLEIGMPLFHFNSRTGDAVLPDPEGEELPTLAAAREVALATAREALIEAVKVGDVATARRQAHSGLRPA